MPSATVTASLEGLGPVLTKLRELPGKVQRRVMLKALRKATTALLRMVRRLAPTRYKILKKSIGRILKYYPATQTVVAVIGPRKGFKTQIRTDKRGRPVYEDPAKIAHLVEFGHAGKALIRTVPEHPFIRPAWDAERENVARALAQELWIGIAAEAKR